MNLRKLLPRLVTFRLVVFFSGHAGHLAITIATSPKRCRLALLTHSRNGFQYTRHIAEERSWLCHICTCVLPHESLHYVVARRWTKKTLEWISRNKACHLYLLAATSTKIRGKCQFYQHQAMWDTVGGSHAQRSRISRRYPIMLYHEELSGLTKLRGVGLDHM